MIMIMLSVGMFDPDCQKNGQQELFGEKLGVCRDPRIHLHYLLRQDRNSHPEQNDRSSHVVRQQSLRGRHQWWSEQWVRRRFLMHRKSIQFIRRLLPTASEYLLIPVLYMPVGC